MFSATATSELPLLSGTCFCPFLRFCLNLLLRLPKLRRGHMLVLLGATPDVDVLLYGRGKVQYESRPESFATHVTAKLANLAKGLPIYPSVSDLLSHCYV
jgi:hypothetical protein